MLSYQEALTAISQYTHTLETEIIETKNALGRVLSEDIFASTTQPPLPLSAMDGYAVRFSDLDSHKKLKCIEVVPAGTLPRKAIKTGQCSRIFTGATLPSGADTIIIQENTQLLGDDSVHILTPAKSCGEFVRKPGLDFHTGDQLVSSPTILSSRHLSLLATANIATLPVAKKPKVNLIATGSELVELGSTITNGQIINSNSLCVSGIAEHYGAIVQHNTLAKDTRQSLHDSIENGQNCDLIITMGGASVGDFDLVKQVLPELGFDIVFQKVAIRPGKPVTFATRVTKKKKQVLLALPGNPVSAYACSLLLVRPLLGHLQGLSYKPLLTIRGVLKDKLPSNGERLHFMRGMFEMDDERQPRVSFYPLQDSSVLTTLALANCLIIREPGACRALPGETVQIIPLNI